MEQLFNIVYDNFALILSTFISIFAVVATIHQSNISKRTQAMDMYFSAQLEAYSELFDIVSKLEIHPTTQENNQYFISVTNKAMILSTHETALQINEFCRTYLTLIHKLSTNQSPDTIAEVFLHEKEKLIFYLIDELSKYDRRLVNKVKHKTHNP